jgi:hypothetical protein
LNDIREKNILRNQEYLKSLGVYDDHSADVEKQRKSNKEQEEDESPEERKRKREHQKSLEAENKIKKKAKQAENIKKLTHDLPALPTRKKHKENNIQQSSSKRRLRKTERISYHCNHCLSEIKVDKSIREKIAIRRHIARNQCREKVYKKNRDGKLVRINRSEAMSFMSIGSIETRFNNSYEPFPNEEINYLRQNEDEQGSTTWDREEYVYDDDNAQHLGDAVLPREGLEKEDEEYEENDCQTEFDMMALFEDAELDIFVDEDIHEDDNEGKQEDEDIYEEDDNQGKQENEDTIHEDGNEEKQEDNADLPERSILPRRANGHIDYNAVIRNEKRKASLRSEEPPLENILEFQKKLIEKFCCTSGDDKKKFVTVRKSDPNDIISLHRTCTALSLSETEANLLLNTVKDILAHHDIQGIHLPKDMRSASAACNQHLKSLPFRLTRRFYPLREKYFGVDSKPREGTSVDILQVIGDALLWSNPANIELESRPCYESINDVKTRVYKNFMSCQLAEKCSTWLKGKKGPDAYPLFISFMFDGAAANTSQTRTQTPLSLMILNAINEDLRPHLLGNCS